MHGELLVLFLEVVNTWRDVISVSELDFGQSFKNVLHGRRC